MRQYCIEMSNGMVCGMIVAPTPKKALEMFLNNSGFHFKSISKVTMSRSIVNNPKYLIAVISLLGGTGERYSYYSIKI